MAVSRRALLGGAAALGGVAVTDLARPFPMFLAEGRGKKPKPTSSAPAGALPGAPTDVWAAPDNTSAVIFFTPPKVTDGGANALAAVTSYTATSSPGGFTGAGTDSGEITVSGLTNGTAYTFTLTATNAAGTGTASAASNSVTPNARIVITAPTDGTDARGAIQAAIDGAASGRAVYLPAGTYTLNGVSNVTGKAGVRFFGAGDTTIITGTRNIGMPTDSWIDHIKLTSLGTTGNTSMVTSGSTATGVHIENVTLRGATGQQFGIWINGNGTVRPSGWTLRKLDVDLYVVGLHFRPGDNILLDQCLINGADGTRQTLFYGGSNNTVSNNIISGGIIGVSWLHFRSILKTYADRGIATNNTVFRNTITNISEEGISYDVIGNLAADVAALDNGNISSKGNGTNQIVFAGGTWSTAGTTDYVGYHACWITGTNKGKTAQITAQSNGTLTLDLTDISYAGVSVGDRVALGGIFKDNVFEQNSVTLKSGSGTNGIILYGLSYGNTIKNNFATGNSTHSNPEFDMAIVSRALAALLLSDINHSGTLGVAPCGYNTIDNNTTDGYNIGADLKDYGSGNGYLNHGDSLTRNVATNGTVLSDWHVMATSGSVGDPGVAILNTPTAVLTHQT